MSPQGKARAIPPPFTGEGDRAEGVVEGARLGSEGAAAPSHLTAVPLPRFAGEDCQPRSATPLAISALSAFTAAAGPSP
jgi:hypothetical protein